MSAKIFNREVIVLVMSVSNCVDKSVSVETFEKSQQKAGMCLSQLCLVSQKMVPIEH